ncbi:MAG: MASE1 domain-containing protein, partial [Vicinamibacterales bacterium]
MARTIAIGAAVAVAYVVAAQIGFRVAFVAEQVTTVWAPTGIAIATLLLWGLRLWPAIWLGAFVANAGAEAPLWTAMVVATGNTCEAVVAAWALRKVPNFDLRLRRVADVLALSESAQASRPPSVPRLVSRRCALRRCNRGTASPRSGPPGGGGTRSVRWSLLPP